MKNTCFDILTYWPVGGYGLYAWFITTQPECTGYTSTVRAYTRPYPPHINDGYLIDILR